MAYDPEAMGVAGKKALAEFDDLWAELSEEQREGAKKVISWLKSNFGAAGYKRLLSPKYDGLLSDPKFE